MRRAKGGAWINAGESTLIRSESFCGSRPQGPQVEGTSYRRRSCSETGPPRAFASGSSGGGDSSRAGKLSPWPGPEQCRTETAHPNRRGGNEAPPPAGPAWPRRAGRTQLDAGYLRISGTGHPNPARSAPRALRPAEHVAGDRACEAGGREHAQQDPCGTTASRRGRAEPWHRPRPRRQGQREPWPTPYGR